MILMLARTDLTYSIVVTRNQLVPGDTALSLNQARVSCELELEPLVFVQCFPALGLLTYVWLLHIVDM